MTITPAVLFDVDGTLVDTNYFHAVAWFRAFRQVGVGVAMADVHRLIGMGADRLVQALLPERDSARDDILHSSHAEHYATYFGIMQPFVQARELLRDIAGRGAKVVLATSMSGAGLEDAASADDVTVASASSTSSAARRAANSRGLADVASSGHPAGGPRTKRGRPRTLDHGWRHGVGRRGSDPSGPAMRRCAHRRQLARRVEPRRGSGTLRRRGRAPGRTARLAGWNPAHAIAGRMIA